MKLFRIDKLRSAVGDPGSFGFTLFELVVTLAVLSVLVVGTIPLTQNAIKRQKELRLRETLRQIRAAIDEFKRDTNGACPQGAITGNRIGRGMDAPADPRSRVVIDDCTIFDSENLDRYPPDLETLVNGVRVKARGISLTGGRPFDDRNATDIDVTEEAYDGELNPIRARVLLTVRILTVDDVGFSHRAGGLHLQYQQGRERFAGLVGYGPGAVGYSGG